MFIGHHAVGFLSKKLAPRTNLGVLMAAALLLDLVWPLFLLGGIEHVMIAPGVTKLSPLNFTDYPWTHSLAMACAWAVAFALAYFVVARSGRGAVVVALAVVSHWVLDFFTHRPDLPLWPHGTTVGLGLWNYPIASIAIESALFAVGILIYRDVAKPVDRIGSIGFWAFVIVLIALYVASAAGMPPKNVRQLAIVALVAWIFPFWAAWFDRHRLPEE